MTRTLLWMLPPALAVLLVDRVSKIWIVEHLDLPARLAIDVVPPYLRLVMAWNRGINFGLFGSDGDAMRWALVAVAATISGVLVVWALRAGGRLLPLAVGLVAGGAAGNGWDRIKYGAVADFLNMSCCGIDNPYAFNVADVAIFAGAALLILRAGQDKKGA